MRTFVLLAAVALAAAATLSACAENSPYEAPVGDSLPVYTPPVRTAMHPAGPRVPLPQGMGLVLLNISIPSTRPSAPPGSGGAVAPMGSGLFSAL
jgi:hypothetical protein